MSNFDSEVKARWGDTLAYKQSSKRISSYSAEDFAKAKADQKALLSLCMTLSSLNN